MIKSLLKNNCKFQRMICSVFVLFFVAMNAYTIPYQSLVSVKAPPITLLDEIFASKNAPSSDTYKKILGDTTMTSALIIDVGDGGTTINEISGSTSITGAYSDADCSTRIRDLVRVDSGTYTFANATPFYVGQEAMSALSGDDAAVQCVSMSIAGSNGEYIEFKFKNMTCNGTSCNSSTAPCKEPLNPTLWVYNTTTPRC